MSRVITGTRRHNRRKKILKLAKGYWGRRSKLYRSAKDSVAKALKNAYRDRKRKKRDFRSLWITRISSLCRENKISYSQFINALKKTGIIINRKALSNLAIEDPEAFNKILTYAKEHIESVKQ
jgi:large subunit ribosomal protein L20